MHNTKYSTKEQKEQLLALVNNPVITAGERETLAGMINSTTESSAAEMIEHLTAGIKQRQSIQLPNGTALWEDYNNSENAF
ncbi:hypothetical protein [Adhaeribacter aquaticus]|uniref:hypothetical protein n=1 Tax=Adhaeribacter aquaticus TaxID=299567 RepID=UPI0004188E16|nr:hypothetical protein [Adhaeribacter aquaticus]